MAASHQKMDEDKEVKRELSAQEVQLKDTDEQSLEVRSQLSSSHRTKGSRASAISMAAAQARADAEAAKARAAYSRKEKELKIEKARLEAELDALNQERDVDAAIAKALVMEAAAAEGSSRGSLADFESLPKEQNAREKVSEYVAKHTHVQDSQLEEGSDLTPQSPRYLPNPSTFIGTVLPLQHNRAPFQTMGHSNASAYSMHICSLLYRIRSSESNICHSLTPRIINTHMESTSLSPKENQELVLTHYTIRPARM